MAEVLGLVASIVQIAGTGAKLSTALYHYTTSAVRADQEIADIADDVKLTSNALESVGEVFKTEDVKGIVTPKAIQDANSIIKRCEAVFADINELAEKRRKVGKDGKKEKGLSVMGKLSHPFKEQRIELYQRKLVSLKHSLALLLHVLQLAQGQARGHFEKSALEQEREKIRELHQKQQDALQGLQALESRLSKIALDDDETLHGSTTRSRVSSMNQATAAAVATSDATSGKSNILTIDLSKPDSDTSDSDTTATDEEDEHLSIAELTQAAKHIQKLLKRITVLQHSFANGNQPSSVHKKRRVHKMYQRFCRKWEESVVVGPEVGSVSDAGAASDTSMQSTVLSGPRRANLLAAKMTSSRVVSSRERKRKSLILPSVLSSRQQSPARSMKPPASPLRTTKPRLPPNDVLQGVSLDPTPIRTDDTTNDHDGGPSPQLAKSKHHSGVPDQSTLANFDFELGSYPPGSGPDSMELQLDFGDGHMDNFDFDSFLSPTRQASPPPPRAPSAPGRRGKRKDRGAQVVPLVPNAASNASAVNPEARGAATYTPLVSPAAMPHDARFQIPDFSVPGAYFSRLTPPTLNAQDLQSRNNTLESSTAPVDVDLNLLGEPAVPSQQETGRRLRSTTKQDLLQAAKAHVRLSPIVKPRQRKTTVASFVPPKEVGESTPGQQQHQRAIRHQRPYGRLIYVVDDEIVEEAAKDGKEDDTRQSDRSNHALEDYHLQLFLLEQENKKRLMRARQEQSDTLPRPETPLNDSTHPTLEAVDASPVVDSHGATQPSWFSMFPEEESALVPVDRTLDNESMQQSRDIDNGVAQKGIRDTLQGTERLTGDGSSTAKCICGFADDDGNTVLCEKCDTWQHMPCYYESAQLVPDVHECVDCAPRTIDSKGAIDRQRERKGRPKSGTKVPKRRTQNLSSVVHTKSWPVQSEASGRRVEGDAPVQASPPRSQSEHVSSLDAQAPGSVLVPEPTSMRTGNTSGGMRWVASYSHGPGYSSSSAYASPIPGQSGHPKEFTNPAYDRGRPPASPISSSTSGLVGHAEESNILPTEPAAHNHPPLLPIADMNLGMRLAPPSSQAFDHSTRGGYATHISGLSDYTIMSRNPSYSQSGAYSPSFNADLLETYPSFTASDRSRPTSRSGRHETTQIPAPRIDVQSPSPARSPAPTYLNESFDSTASAPAALPYPVDDMFVPSEQHYQSDDANIPSPRQAFPDLPWFPSTGGLEVASFSEPRTSRRRSEGPLTNSPSLASGVSKSRRRKGPLPAIVIDPSDKMALKRARNTLAARASRQRKLDRVNELETMERMVAQSLPDEAEAPLIDERMAESSTPPLAYEPSGAEEERPTDGAPDAITTFQLPKIIFHSGTPRVSLANTRTEHLQRHQKSHEEDTTHICNFSGCGKTFYRLDLIQRHQERHQDIAHQIPAGSEDLAEEATASTTPMTGFPRTPASYIPQHDYATSEAIALPSYVSDSFLIPKIPQAGDVHVQAMQEEPPSPGTVQVAGPEEIDSAAPARKALKHVPHANTSAKHSASESETKTNSRKAKRQPRVGQSAESVEMHEFDFIPENPDPQDDHPPPNKSPPMTQRALRKQRQMERLLSTVSGSGPVIAYSVAEHNHSVSKTERLGFTEGKQPASYVDQSTQVQGRDDGRFLTREWFGEEGGRPGLDAQVSSTTLVPAQAGKDGSDEKKGRKRVRPSFLESERRSKVARLAGKGSGDVVEERNARDIVDVLLEQWTVSVS